MTVIRTKKQFYALWNKGLLGNKPHTWKTYDELVGSRYKGKVGLRSKKIGGQCYYRVDKSNAIGMMYCNDRFTASESMPDDVLLLQGEVTRNEVGLELTWNCTPNQTMRDAMKYPLRNTGLVAQQLLRSVLWPSSYDDLMDLLDQYPDHVIEFGVHDKAVGIYPNRNMVVWEVRAY
jgi:hypothetical protein